MAWSCAAAVARYQPSMLRWQKAARSWTYAEPYQASTAGQAAKAAE